MVIHRADVPPVVLGQPLSQGTGLLLLALLLAWAAITLGNIINIGKSIYFNYFTVCVGSTKDSFKYFEGSQTRSNSENTFTCDS